MKLIKSFLLFSILVFTSSVDAAMSGKNDTILASGTYHLRSNMGCQWKLDIKNNITSVSGSSSPAFIGIPDVEPNGKLSAIIQHPGNGVVLLGIRNRDSIQVFVLKLNGKEKLPLEILNMSTRDQTKAIRAFKDEKSCLN